ncbi:MAG: hypothetical protein IJH00_01540 [Erysipelotrichaceae bacterium]|nr:hypothetical protein [Erysipelotrichaceae bacterium]
MNRYQKEDRTSYSLGMSLTIEALKHRSTYVEEVILSEKALKNEQFSYLLELCEANDIKPVYDDKLIEKLSVKENCYCIGIFRKFHENRFGKDHIVLYGFNDFGELGTVLRSAVSFDFKDIVLIDCDIDYFDPRCIRSSMGSIFHTNIVSYDSFAEYSIVYPKQNICAFVSQADKELKELSLKSPYSLLISQDYKALDRMFENEYMIRHENDREISLSVRSSIILSVAYHLKRSL